MSLFGKHKDIEEKHNNNESKDFNNIVVDTESVKEELIKVSSSTKIPLKMLDFEIISFSTSYKNHKDDEWVIVEEDNIEWFEDEDFLLNEELIIKQSYKIKIYKKDENFKEPVHIVLGGNRYLSKVVATIKKDPPAIYNTSLASYIASQINKKLLKQSMFISLFQDKMLEEIEKIVSKIRINGSLKEDETFIVCSCVDPVVPIDDAIIYHYRKVKNRDSHDRVDYAKRGYIHAVRKGDIIIEYVKAKEGKSGRNCRGEYIKVDEPKQSHTIDFSISENILRKEDEDRIIFVAKKDGYVRKEGDKYDIDDKIEVNEISLRTTGSVEAKLDANVKIDIKGKDEFKDAIGSGMHVESAEINVGGNVGSGAVVRAKIAEIKGQTHKSSSIYADKLDIKIHRGYAEGDEVSIQRLEGGKVNAKVAKIEQVIGGEIIAHKIYVDILMSNATLIASEHIEIKGLRGSDNKFIIDSSKVSDRYEEVEKLEKRLKAVENEIILTKKEAKSKKLLIEKSKESIEIVKQKILELKKEGKEPSANLLNKIKEYHTLVEAYNALIDIYEKQKEEKERIRNEIDEIQSTLTNAKIINHSIWKEYNEIKFVLLSPKIEITHTTKEGEISKLITLKKLEEGEFEIVRKNEIEE